MGYTTSGGAGCKESESSSKVSTQVGLDPNQELDLYQCGCLSCGAEWKQVTIPRWCPICKGNVYYI